jgi:hypothetical protein
VGALSAHRLRHSFSACVSRAIISGSIFAA